MFGNIRKMAFNKRLVLAIAVMAGFVFLLFALIMSYQLSLEGKPSPLLAPLVEYHLEFMVVMSTLGLAVGAGVFYLMSEKVEAREKESRENAELILSFLDETEKKVIAFLVENNGAAYQSEIGRLEGMNRLKAHRMVLKLLKRNVVTTERRGKANKLFLAPHLFEALSNKS